LERTQLFAKTCNYQPEFIPNPSTWFNQERYEDAPETWRKSGFAGAKPQPAIIRPNKFEGGVSKL
jgi:hypothetical protein